MPLFLPLAMIAAFLAAMVAIKVFVAPWIVHEYGIFGVLAAIALCFAVAKRLEA